MKVRASYGVTGNNKINDYSAYATLSPVNAIIGDNLVQGFTQTSIANPDLTWERTMSTNAGIDLQFLENRIGLSFDVYTATTDQLLLEVSVPSATGYLTQYQNAGKMNNKGFDLELNAFVIDNDKFTWQIGGNISHYRNTLLDFGGVDQLITTPDPKRPSQFIAEVGSPLVQFYGYETESEIPLGDLNTGYYPVDVDAQSVYVKDLNGDGEITDEDRTVLGSPIPDFVWGITTSLKFGQWDASAVLQGSQGAEVFNIDPYYYNSHWRGSDNLSDEEAAFTKTQVVTDQMVQDASFIALRSVNLGYTVPKSVTKNFGVRVYFTGYNLFYKMADSYTSYNPEGVNLFNDNPLTQGYQRGAAPQYRTFAGGLNLTF